MRWIQGLLYVFGNWRLQRKMWKAAELLMSCGQENGSVQDDINKAKDSIYSAINVAERRYKCLDPK